MFLLDIVLKVKIVKINNVAMLLVPLSIWRTGPRLYFKPKLSLVTSKSCTKGRFSLSGDSDMLKVDKISFISGGLKVKKAILAFSLFKSSVFISFHFFK